MSGHGKYLGNKLLLLIFNAQPIANIADNAASSPLTDLYVSLHTDDPLFDGDQTTHECGYTSYTRKAVARTSGGWTITDNRLVPTADIVFPACTGGSEIAKFFIIGTALSGAGHILYLGALDPVISISSTIVPKIRSSSSIQEN